jgi:uncharacterized protein YqeY
MTTKQTLEQALKDAMRSGDELQKRVLRMALTAIKLAEVEKRRPLDEPELLSVLSRESKSRHETIADAEKAGRPDLATAAQEELEALQAYLPAPLDDLELEGVIRAAIEESGAAGPQDMGKVMRIVMDKVQGRADGKTVSARVKSLLE